MHQPEEVSSFDHLKWDDGLFSFNFTELHKKIHLELNCEIRDMYLCINFFRKCQKPSKVLKKKQNGRPGHAVQ